MSHNVVIKDVEKKYGDFIAIRDLSLDIKKGEFFTLLGPSGCGKTTLLRMIAGFNSIEDGQILFGDKVINKVEAHKRDIGMVFQNYAIFPHLTVYENVAYGLKAKKVPKNEISSRVEKALELVQIAQLKDRKPSELSGGQQQRVALARAFVIEPGILLMDEPLSNLDAKLRVQMRTVIRKLQKTVGITTIYVTHDQEEALAISDRIAIMKSGDIMQVGSPEEIYKKPANIFVAGFIGTSNFINGEITKVLPNNTAEVRFGNDSTFIAPIKKDYTGKVIISARPEQLIFSDEGIQGKITISTFLGDFVNYEIEIDNGQTIELNEYTKDTDTVKANGEKVRISFNPSKIGLYNADTEEALSW